ncbi:hypothetical protein B0H19DRAFT_1169717 [Mycena capillaripes]|nr:hypothetical protein B0H19DRAFT_1169717 [Mycena capillaripes]
MDDTGCTSPGCTGSAGVSGRCTAEAGYLAYFEIKEISDALAQQNEASSAVNFVPQDGYYLVFDNQWVGYDDEYSFQAKVDIINSRGLRGGILWAVDLEYERFYSDSYSSFILSILLERWRLACSLCWF